MPTPPTLSGEAEILVQTAFNLCKAVDQPDPKEFLQSCLELHNIAEYALFQGSSLGVLVAMSSENVAFAANCAAAKSKLQLQPTVFIAFSNQTRFPGQESSSSSSLANFLAPQRPCGFAGVENFESQAVATKVLEELPMQTILSLLGQGYKLVATGFKFGGMLAHLFVTKLLLQLRQEIEMAKQLGIDLPDSLGGNKVFSYAFSAPFFGGDALNKALSRTDLVGNLNTIWRAGDASPYFFTACSELFIETSPTAPSETNIPPELQPANQAQLRSPQVEALQAWAKHVSDIVASLPRGKAAGKLMAAPLDPNTLARCCSPAGVLTPPLTPEQVAEQLAKLNGNDGPEAGTPKVSGARARRASYVESPTTPKSPAAASAAAAAAAASTSGVVGSSGARRARRASLLLNTAASPGGAGSPAAADSPKLSPHGSSSISSSAWKDSLVSLLQLIHDASGPNYRPIGQFWLLETTKQPAAGAPGGDGERANLVPVEHARVIKCCNDWLSPGSSQQLFGLWESSLEELTKLMMDAFPWTTFRNTLTIGGNPVDRKLLLQPAKALQLC